MTELDGLDISLFTSAGTVASLEATRCAAIPRTTGVYLVLRREDAPPSFLRTSTGGWFKGADPSYPLPEVEERWVSGAHVLYVGMTACKGGLRKRIQSLVRFGTGHGVSHRGGRMLWHLADSESLEVWWRDNLAGVPRQLESELIAAFRARYGARPFANVIG